MPIDNLTGKPAYDPPRQPREIPALIPEKDWEEIPEKKPMSGEQTFEHRIWKLLQVYNNDIMSGCFAPGSVKINMAARKKYFTDGGWSDYQKYVEEVRSHLNKERPLYSVYGILDAKSKKYSHWFGSYSGLSVEGTLEHYNSCDTVGLMPKFELMVKFSPIAAIDPKNILIDTWRVKVDYPSPPKVSPYLYKSKSRFLIFTCKTFGLGCG